MFGWCYSPLLGCGWNLSARARERRQRWGWRAPGELQLPLRSCRTTQMCWGHHKHHQPCPVIPLLQHNVTSQLHCICALHSNSDCQQEELHCNSTAAAAIAAVFSVQYHHDGYSRCMGGSEPAALCCISLWRLLGHVAACVGTRPPAART